MSEISEVVIIETVVEPVIVEKKVKPRRFVPGALRREKSYYAEYYRKNLAGKANCTVCDSLIGIQKMKVHQKTKKCMAFCIVI
jgi:hypothetical protein